jgi:hypothetical protein
MIEEIWSVDILQITDSIFIAATAIPPPFSKASSAGFNHPVEWLQDHRLHIPLWWPFDSVKNKIGTFFDSDLPALIPAS